MPKTSNPFSRSLTPNSRRCLRYCASVFLTLAWLALSAAQAQTTNYALGTSALLEGPAAGTDSVVLAVTPPTATWTNTANADWLHLSMANQSGAGSTNVIFTFDANPATTRTATLTIAGQTLTVTQAGSTYVAAGSLTNLVSSGLGIPDGVALDAAGNVFIANFDQGAIKKWTAANNTVTTVVSLGVDTPGGVALDGAGNVYFSDGDNNVVQEWMPANSNVITLVSSGLLGPSGVAVDAAGNVYIADTGNNAIKEWSPANSNVTTLASSGLLYPIDVAVDGAGNVYIADRTLNAAVKKWSAASNTVTTLVSSRLPPTVSLAVDGAGNIYFGVGLDYNSAIAELPRAFVDTTPRSESLAAGSDALPVVLPATENLLPPFAPTSDQPWLTITGITNDVVNFSFTATTTTRTANITLLGQTISITQAGITPPILTSAQMLANGACQFCFTNTVGASFTVLSATNLSLPLTNWTVAGTASNTAPGQFQFTTPPATNDSQRFYTVRSP